VTSAGDCTHNPDRLPFTIPKSANEMVRRLDHPDREEQIIAILKQGEAGLTTAELCRQHGITEQTYYRWKAKYGGMDSSEAKKLKQLEDENRKLKHVVAELTLDNRALKDVLSKNW